MLERLKNWLIKRLGGYTKEEYNDWSRIPIAEPLIVERKFRSIDLHSERIVHYEEVMAHGAQQIESRAKRGIIDELSHAMLPYIDWRKKQSPGDFAIRIEGVLCVQERV